MTAQQIESASAELAEKLFAHPAYQRAEALYGYLSYNQEVRTAAILERAQQDGKRVAVPKVYGDTMKFLWLDDLGAVAPGAYGIPEPVADGPVAEDPAALVLMPGLAFDREGHRMGYGGGTGYSIDPGIYPGFGGVRGDAGSGGSGRGPSPPGTV